MPELKCVGGACDGQMAFVHNYNSEHDQIRVHAKITFEISKFEDDVKAFREGRTPNSITQPYHYYKICTFHFVNNGQRLKLNYLIPTNWTEFDAFKHLIAAHQAHDYL